MSNETFIQTQCFTLFNQFLSKHNNAVFCLLSIKDVSQRSKYPKDKDLDRDEHLNINFINNDVYKNCCCIVQIGRPHFVVN